jgi:hypothetical protein
MKKRWAMKWADALESGDYKQCSGRLRNRIGYCCLGVVVEVAGGSFRKDEGGAWMESRTGCSSLLPNWVAAKMDFRSSEDLAGKNDKGWNFEEIAAYIRKEYKLL